MQSQFHQATLGMAELPLVSQPLSAGEAGTLGLLTLLLVTNCNPRMLALQWVASMPISSMGQLLQQVGMEQMEIWLGSTGTVVRTSLGAA